MDEFFFHFSRAWSAIIPIDWGIPLTLVFFISLAGMFTRYLATFWVHQSSADRKNLELLSTYLENGPNDISEYVDYEDFRERVDYELSRNSNQIRRTIRGTFVLVLVQLLIIMFFSVSALLALSTDSNYDQICNLADYCSAMTVFTFDIMLRALAFDIMETFQFSFASITYDGGFSPFSVTALIVRLAPVLFVLDNARRLYLAIVAHRAALTNLKNALLWFPGK